MSSEGFFNIWVESTYVHVGIAIRLHRSKYRGTSMYRTANCAIFCSVYKSE